MENMNKSKHQYESSAKAAGYSIIAMVVLIIFATLFGGCATTKKTDKCCTSADKIIEHYEKTSTK